MRTSHTHGPFGSSKGSLARRVSRPSRSGSATVEIVIVVALGCLLAIGLAVTSARGGDAQSTMRVYVERGDTCWSLATGHPVSGQTTQQTAEQIARLNHLTPGTLNAGTAVSIPASLSDAATVARR